MASHLDTTDRHEPTADHPRVERTATAGTISTAPERRLCDVCFADLGPDGKCPCACEHCNRVPRMDRP